MRSAMRMLLPLLGMVTLAACDTERAPETADVATQGIPPAVRIATTEQRHLVYVTPGTGKLSPQEQMALSAFIADNALGAPDAVHVRLRGTLSATQLAGVTRAVAGAGVQPAKIEIESVPASDIGVGPGQNAYNAVEVVVSTSRADPPTCPRLSWLSVGGNDNPVSSNFGCPSISNLEAMVADPRDLVQGESGGSTDAQITNAAIERLHADKLKRLSQETTTNSAAGTTSGGGQ